MDARSFDLELFRELNREYETRRIAAPLTTAAQKQTRAEKRADRIARLFDVRGKRVLDLGCGRGEVARALAANHGARVLAVDIAEYDDWARPAPGVDFIRADLAEAHEIPPRSIDVAYSFSVLEHVRHPFAMLHSVRDLLTDEGRFLLVAHLYRSATGSHRSRDVFFPWPHLLFTDDVFEAFYREENRAPQRPAWLNKLTYADYFRYFEMLGFVVEKEFARRRELDRAFFERFADELGKYATFDLTTNAVEVILSVAPGAGRRPPGPENRLVRRKAIDKETSAKHKRGAVSDAPERSTVPGPADSVASPPSATTTRQPRPEDRDVLRKLRKLKKDPKLFLYDAVRKRVPEKFLDSQVTQTSNKLTISADGFDVVNGLVLMSHPAVVEVLRGLKKRKAKITISWS